MMMLMIWQKHWCSILQLKCYDGWWWWCDVIHGCGKNNDDDCDGAYDDDDDDDNDFDDTADGNADNGAVQHCGGWCCEWRQ